ncbi:FAD-dependent oxidoreductase [Sphaerisporangium dianthi]|uniref:FAD-dependent oxidoreductase n=1 Tax=Sphaerisporangium dianthi TaxID=1436120 RepID=A0ABV9CJW8_9ACTN
MSTLGKVLIIGSGLGGLTLARSLRGGAIDVAVFERDASPWDRPQGYRLHLDDDAVNAAREVLPGHLIALFEATSQFTEPFTAILSTDLSVVKRLPSHDDHGDHGDVWPDRGNSVHANVDRATLRQILMSGLDDVVHFGKKLERYENTADGVTAYFSDGTTAHGDVLVGADGVRSAVRAQRAPRLTTVDAGITAIYGRLPLDAARLRVPVEALTDIFAIASDDRKVFLGLGSVRFPTAPAKAAAHWSPGTAMRDQDDYVVCVVGGRHRFFPGADDLSGERLRDLAAGTVADWHGQAADLVRQGDAEAFFPVRMHTSVPGSLDAPTNVTLLGDAVHAMTPTLGRGANLAMRDAALLGRALRAVAAGDGELGEALSRYERDMTAYGFSVVREAARIGEQRMAQNPLPA